MFSADFSAEAIHGLYKMENIINSFDSLYKAYKNTRSGKKKNTAALEYELNAVERTLRLSESLQNRDYTFGPYFPFTVYEPKERLVLALDFQSKVVLHSFCDNLLVPVFFKRFITDNYAGQIGKGTHFGLDRLAENMRHYYFSRKQADNEARKAASLPYRCREEWDYAEGWVLKGDFSKFYYSINREICYNKAAETLKKAVDDAELLDFSLWLLKQVIDSAPNTGLPLGNQSSSPLALLYLDGLDHLLTDELGLVYGRYMDDFYIIHSDKLALKNILKTIRKYTEPLGIVLNGKTQIFPLKNGIDFLGYHSYLTESGKVVRKVRERSINNMRRKIRKYRGKVDRGEMTLEQVRQSYTSWIGHISHGNTHRLKQNTDALFYAVFSELKPKNPAKKRGIKPEDQEQIISV